MSLPRSNGQYDPVTNIFTAPNTGTWANLTTWSAWNCWINQPQDWFTVSSEIFDRGTSDKFNIITETEVIGNVTYSVYTCANIEFNSNVTISNIVPNQSNVSCFSGRFYYVQANVASAGTLARLDFMRVTSTDRTIDIRISDVESATMTQTALGAQLPLDRVVSGIDNVQITCHDGGNTAPLATDTTHYYMETPIYRALIPYITSKDRTGPTFQLRDINYGTLATGEAGHFVDARITALPEQYHDGRNLRTR